MTEAIDTQTVVEETERTGMWLIVLGILQVIVGFFALVSPLYSGVAVALIVGIIILMNGFFDLFSAFKAPTWGKGLFRFFGGLLGLLAGLLVLLHPLAGLNFLTLLLAFYFFFDGFERLVLGMRLPGVEGRGWIVFGGAVSLLLGIMILVKWPLSTVWAVGTLAGIHIILGGWAKLMVGTGARIAAQERR
jgi:uncharacterized membrane protein HdeD (DUF308 family)